MQLPRVLVVSADESVLKMVSEVLRTHGYEVRTLARIERGAFEAFLPDAVLADTPRLSAGDESALRAIGSSRSRRYLTDPAVPCGSARGRSGPYPWTSSHLFGPSGPRVGQIRHR